ncbi:MAG: hypothetical protein ACJ8CB_10350 [Ktedonobacteraceae bacterium]
MVTFQVASSLPTAVRTYSVLLANLAAAGSQVRKQLNEQAAANGKKS